MGWTTTTWNSAYGLGPSGNLRTGLFELCRALNEREALIGMDLTEFYMGDGTEGSDIATADFVGLPISAPSGHSLGANLQRLYDGLVLLLARGAFIDANDTSSVWTISTLQAEIGGALDEIPGLLPSAALMARWQAAFDLLTAIIAAPAQLEERREGTQTSTAYSTPDLAWAARDDEAISPYDGRGIGYDVTFHNSTGPKYRSRVVSRKEYVLDPTRLRATSLPLAIPFATGITGTVLGAKANWAGGTSEPFSNTFQYAVNGTPYTHDGTTESETLTQSIAVANLVDPFSVTLQALPEPSSNPFPSAGPWFELGSVEFELTGAGIFIDVSANFSDQE